MKVVWKYRLEKGGDDQYISMPRMSMILDVQMQGCVPVMWALVDPSTQMEERWFILVFTGEESTRLDGAAYKGTFQAGGRVYHLFEKFDEIEIPF